MQTVEVSFCEFNSPFFFFFVVFKSLRLNRFFCSLYFSLEDNYLFYRERLTWGPFTNSVTCFTDEMKERGTREKQNKTKHTHTQIMVAENCSKRERHTHTTTALHTFKKKKTDVGYAIYERFLTFVVANCICFLLLYSNRYIYI